MATKQPIGPFWPWLHQGLENVTQHYGQNGETGIDMGLPMGTPITSLTNGTVLGHGYYGGGGVVSVGSFINNVATSVYYQHLDTIAPEIDHATTPVHVKAGDLLGYSGGQLSGGTHPSQPKFSSGPHLEVGLNAPYGGMWHPLGKNSDPEPWLRHLDSQNHPDGGALNSLASFFQQTAGGGVQVNNGWLPFLRDLDAAETIPPFDGGVAGTNTIASLVGMVRGTFVRLLIVIVGLVMLLAILNNIAQSGVLQPVRPPAWVAGLLPQQAESAAI